MSDPNERLCLTRKELDDLLDAAAERGASRALELVGLGDKDSAKDVQWMRGFAQSVRTIRETTLQTLTRAVVVAVIGLIMLGISVKVKLLSLMGIT
jgi:hypothetical protein